MQPFLTPDDPNGGDQTAAAAHAVLGRLEQLRSLGPGWESFPALLDENTPEERPTWPGFWPLPTLCSTAWWLSPAVLVSGFAMVHCSSDDDDTSPSASAGAQ